MGFNFGFKGLMMLYPRDYTELQTWRFTSCMWPFQCGLQLWHYRNSYTSGR